jgi:hypothetical protein
VSGEFVNRVYEPILPIRLLLLRNADPESFAIAETLMDHLEGGNWMKAKTNFDPRHLEFYPLK